MANEMTGMWGATDLNDLIRGLKMVLAQAEDVRACGGTLADVKAIGTCGTCNNAHSVMCDYGRNITKCEGYPHVCHECDENFYEKDDYKWGNEEEVECGENCPNYGSCYCDVECDGHPYSDDDDESVNNRNEEPTLEDIARRLQDLIADLDYLDS